MWFSKVWAREDEESLLPPSPTSSTSLLPDVFPDSVEKWRRLPRVLLNLLYQLLLFTVPSFCRRSSGAGALSEKTPPAVLAPKKHSTEYLDGVRGLASLIVFIFHWTHIHYPHVNSGYTGEQGSSYWQLPIIRFVYSGAAMVSVFFVVSGYVLAHRFVQKMYRHDFDSLFAGLTSLTFRRAVRLFLPSLGSCLLAYLCVSLNLIGISDGFKFSHGLSALLRYVDLETTPWTWEPYMTGFYNPQLWSIALEFRGSLVVFIMILGLARTRPSIRLLVEVLVTAHAFAHKRWDMALFIAGMILAEVDVWVHSSRSRKAVVQKKRVKLVFWFMLLAGIYLTGFPRDDVFRSLGYTFSKYIWPFTDYRRRFWLGIGAILLVAPMPFLPPIQAFFNTAVIRYLGKISFALYLIHGITNRTLGVWLIRHAWILIGRDSDLTCAASYIVTTLLYVPVLICWSDMYWRAVDIPATKFAKWLEVKSQSQLSLPES